MIVNVLLLAQIWAWAINSMPKQYDFYLRIPEQNLNLNKIKILKNVYINFQNSLP